MEQKEKQIWFKRKTYGWGWTPATWQGWTIILGWTTLFVLGTLLLEGNTTILVIYTGLLVAILVKLCYKYGESPRWQWGEKNL